MRRKFFVGILIPITIMVTACTNIAVENSKDSESDVSTITVSLDGMNIDEEADIINNNEMVEDEVSDLKVITSEKEYSCEKCGNVVLKTQEEYIVISDSCSQYADDINNLIYQDLVSVSAEDIYGNSEDDCSIHDEEFATKYNTRVFGYDIIKDNLLTIDVSSEITVFAAPHPYLDERQYVYDLESGKKVEIEAFYGSSESDFKALIAEATHDYYIENTETQLQFASDINEDNVFDRAYENASFDNTRLFMKEDCVELAYIEDAIVPHGNGEIRIRITYDKFGA